MIYVGLLIEGNLDETVGRRIAEHCGLEVSVVYGKRGFGYIRKKIASFNKSAAGMPLIVIADSMDMPEPCPPAVIATLLQRPHRNTRFRLAVQEIESWLLADARNLAKFLGVRRQEIPSDPDSVVDPKQEIVRLARLSGNKTIRHLLVPSPISTGPQGPGYTSEMQRFALYHWDIVSSLAVSRSLQKCVSAVDTLRYLP